jgi:GxxExxY protein
MTRMERIFADRSMSGIAASYPPLSARAGFSSGRNTMLHEDITSKVIAAFYTVYNTLGYGFLEKVYENALILELKKRGLKVLHQVPIQVRYEGHVIGEYFSDLLVEDRVILELKAAEDIVKAHENQLVNYLKATNLEVGLVLNFGPEPKFKRKISTNLRKPALKAAQRTPEKSSQNPR